MKWFLLVMFFCTEVYAQLNNSVEFQKRIDTSSVESAKKELLFDASMKSIEKFAPEMGYKFEQFETKLNQKFISYFESYKEKKLAERFGKNYKTTLSDKDKSSFLNALELQRNEEFIKFSRVLGAVSAYSFKRIDYVEGEGGAWVGNVDLTLDRIRLERLLRKFINDESKPYSKLLLLSEIDLFSFGWGDLGLENAESFLDPINTSWLKWLNENLPTTVEEVVVCDSLCKSFYSSWSEASQDELEYRVTPDFTNAVWVKVTLHLKRTNYVASAHESRLQWDGRVILQDVNTKRILGTYELGEETRTFREADQKLLNSAIASALYRSPLSAFTQFSRKLQEKVGLNRVSKLTIKGHKHLGDALALMDLLRTRGSALGLEVNLDHFTKDAAQLICFYKGEEKSFTDLLSALKELKSSQSYVLVNEFTGTQHVLKLVAE